MSFTPIPELSFRLHYATLDAVLLLWERLAERGLVEPADIDRLSEHISAHFVPDASGEGVQADVLDKMQATLDGALLPRLASLRAAASRKE